MGKSCKVAVKFEEGFGRNKYEVQSKAKQIDLSMDDLPSIKALGEILPASSDQFPLVENIALTKRKFLSKISKLFDPLGFVTPVVVRAKILMQEVWISGIDCNDQLPENISDEARK